MARELLLVRHGKAAPDINENDRERPLKDRGKRDLQRLGVWLWQQQLRPDLVISSPAERALVSAEKCCKAMDLSAAIIRKDERLYPGSLDVLRPVLAELPEDAARIMLVGHNPACLDLLHWLLPPVPHAPPVETGALFRLRLPDKGCDLQAGCAELLARQRGHDLPKGFPYPAPHGSEQRERPAYYYTQSAVIPYRYVNDSLQVLLVRSSKRSHWVVPKGVSGPGHSLQESARNEAFEEAGVEGEVLDTVLGRFPVAKWGAECMVTVYPMRVTRVLPEEEWEEQHRGREWLSCAPAAERVRHIELGEMIRTLPDRALPG